MGNGTLNEDDPSDHTFEIRRARLDIRGVLENDWGYRLYGTFIGERNGILQEGWPEYRKYGGLRIRAGEVFEPFWRPYIRPTGPILWSGP